MILDVNKVVRQVMRATREGRAAKAADGSRVYARSTWQWTQRGEPEPWAEVDVTLALGAGMGEAILRFDIDHLTRPTGPQRQRVDLVATPCRYGGVRWWWICPRKGARCIKLYLPNGGQRFLSRRAYRLDYASQRGTRINRAHCRLRRLYRKLGSDYATRCRTPDKPKGMHWRTYGRIVEKVTRANQVLDDGLYGFMARRGWI